MELTSERIAKMVALMGGDAELGGVPIRTEIDLFYHIDARLSVTVLDRLAKALGMRPAHLADSVKIVREKTASDGKALLDRASSERAVRLAYVLSRAHEVFGDPKKAISWLTKERAVFGSRIPLELVSTEIGGAIVDNALGSSEHGVFD